MHVKVNRPNNLNIIVNNYYIIAVYSVDRTQYSLKIFLYILSLSFPGDEKIENDDDW